MIKWQNKEGLIEAIESAGHYLYTLDGEWVCSDVEAVQKIIDEYQESPSVLKLRGVEIDGVMCSATAADQAGLTAVFLAVQMQGANFKPTRFDFENGNKLTITLENFQRFTATWMAFRQSFFVEAD